LDQQPEHRASVKLATGRSRAIECPIASPYKRSTGILAVAGTKAERVENLIAAAIFIEPEYAALEVGDSTHVRRPIKRSISPFYQRAQWLISIEPAQDLIATAVPVQFEDTP